MSKAKVRPTSIMIFGRKTRIEEIEMDDYGQYHSDINAIKIKAGLSDEEFLTTLFHECIHCCLNIGGPSFVLGRNEEEMIVRCIENALFPILKNFL